MSNHHTANGFQNENPRACQRSLIDVAKWLRERPREFRAPSPVAPSHYPASDPPAGGVRVFFVGHSTMLIEAAGVRILTDPVYSDTCSPVPGNGPRRFHPPGIPFEELPSVDVVLVSHNHYDHLDRPTIGRLGDGPRYVVPPGLGKWFRRLGCSKVTELDWWEEVDAGGARITATPAQHWSKRAAADTNRSLWCGFAISAGGLSVFFAGDSGYCDGFGRIGGRIGPFTVAALPIGGYAPPWFMGEVHMNPEEAVAACADVGARILLPIHHGTFRLSDEEPAEPAERVRAEWERRGNALADLWLLNPGENRALTGIGA